MHSVNSNRLNTYYERETSFTPPVDQIHSNTSTATSSVFSEILVPIFDNSRYSFLWNRIRVFTISFENFSFTVEQFISNSAIREQALTEIQKRIRILSNDLLEELKNGKHVNLETAVKLANLHNFHLLNLFLKTAHIFIKTLGLEAVGFNDFQKLVSFFDKIIRACCKWHEGRISIDKQKLIDNYLSIHKFVSVSCDTLSSAKDIVSLLDDNWFIKWGYYWTGYGWEFSPIAAEVMSNFLFIHNVLTPIRWVTKYNELIDCHNKYVKLQKNALCSTPELQKIANKINKKYLEFARESIKLAAWTGVLTGVFATTPAAMTITVGGLSLYALNQKIHSCWSNKKKNKPPEII